MSPSTSPRCTGWVHNTTRSSGLHEVKCPVTVARGGRADFGPAAVAQPVSEALPDGRLEVFEALGHFGPLEDPAAVAEAAERALQRSS